MASEKARVTGIAERYATALFELADNEQLIDKVKADLEGLRTLLATSTAFQHFVRSPVLSRESQVKCMAAVSKAGELSLLTQRFLGVVAINRRLSILPVVITAFLAKIAEHQGKHRVRVIAVQSLSKHQQTTLMAALSTTMGIQVEIEVKIDPMLLGGLVVKIGSRMVDSSLRTKLQRLQLAMKGIG